MLYIETVEPGTIALLRELQHIPELNGFALVGGTALTLKFGHRKSLDIDLFGFPLDKAHVIERLIEKYGTQFDYRPTRPTGQFSRLFKG